MRRSLFIIILTLCAFAATASAQGNKPAAGGAVPAGKMAIIDSRSFGEGIGEMKKQLDKLETEFQPRYKELGDLQNQLVKLDEDLKNPKADPKILQQKADQMAGMKKDFDRKREDFQQDYQKRSEVILGPLRDKVLKFLETYAANKGIVIVFDLAPAAQAGLVFLNPGTNITDDFIKEYNKANPSPSAPPQP